MEFIKKINKAWVAAAVPFVSLSLLTFFDIDITSMEGTIIALINGVLVYAIPNIPGPSAPANPTV